MQKKEDVTGCLCRTRVHLTPPSRLTPDHSRTMRSRQLGCAVTTATIRHDDLRHGTAGPVHQCLERVRKAYGLVACRDDNRDVGLAGEFQAMLFLGALIVWR